MAVKLERTATPGIFRRHSGACPRSGRCDCAYVVVWRHRGKQATQTFRTFAEAREAKGSRDAGDRRPASRVRVEDYFAEWIVSFSGRTQRGFSETTREGYRRPIERRVLPRWGSWRLADVEPADVRQLLREVSEEGAGIPTLRKLRAALSAMFATAVEDGALRANPVRGVRIPAGPSSPAAEKAKALTRSELSAFLTATPPEWRLFFEFLTHTGLRISEAIGLTWAHVDLGERPRIRVREQFYRGKRGGLKSGTSRRDIPLSPDMAARLLTHRRDTYGGEERPLFPSKAGAELHGSNVARRVLKPAGVRAGLLRPEADWNDPTVPESWVSFHTFRHTCASLLFEAGRNVKQVQEWLGHSDAGFTLQRYVHLMDAGVGDAGFLDKAVRVNAGSTQSPQPTANDRGHEAVPTHG